MKRFLTVAAMALVLAAFMAWHHDVCAQGADDGEYDFNATTNDDGSVDIDVTDSNSLEFAAKLHCPTLKPPRGRNLAKIPACAILNQLKGVGCTEVAETMLGCP